MSAPRRAVGTWRDERGQTATEFLMIAGLLTAIIIVMDRVVVGAVVWAVSTLLNHLVTHLSTV